MIRPLIFPSLGKVEKQDDELEYKESELNGGAEQPITFQAKRKQRSLSSLEDKVNASDSNCMDGRRKSIARKVLPSEGSANYIQNPNKSVEAHSESKNICINVNNFAQDDKQVGLHVCVYVYMIISVWVGGWVHVIFLIVTGYSQVKLHIKLTRIMK